MQPFQSDFAIKVNHWIETWILSCWQGDLLSLLHTLDSGKAYKLSELEGMACCLQTSRSCGGLYALAEAFFAFRAKNTYFFV